MVSTNPTSHRRVMYNDNSNAEELTLGRQTMTEHENPPIQITTDDIREANQLSLHCPMCAGAVERNVEDPALQPVVCANCGTLYHKACWEQNGGKCAILGCDHNKVHVYGIDTTPVLQIDYSDLPAQNGQYRTQQKRLKDEQRRQVEELRRPSLLRRLFQWLLDQIRIG